MKVFANSTATEPVASGSRVSTCRSSYAKIELCTEHHLNGNDHCSYCDTTCYGVAYHANNATSGTALGTVTFRPGETVTIADNTGNLERTGYLYADWNTAADGNGTNYSAGTSTSSSVTLYAKWEPITYTVRFHKNDGGTDVYTNQTFTYDVAQNLTANAFNRTGYAFLGWSTEVTGGVTYTDGQSVSNLTTTPNAVVDLFAVWAEIGSEANPYLIKDKNALISFMYCINGGADFYYSYVDNQCYLSASGLGPGTYNTVPASGAGQRHCDQRLRMDVDPHLQHLDYRRLRFDDENDERQRRRLHQAQLHRSRSDLPLR